MEGRRVERRRVEREENGDEGEWRGKRVEGRRVEVRGGGGGGREQKQQQKKEHNIIKVSDYILSYNFYIEINM